MSVAIIFVQVSSSGMSAGCGPANMPAAQLPRGRFTLSPSKQDSFVPLIVAQAIRVFPKVSLVELDKSAAKPSKEGVTCATLAKYVESFSDVFRLFSHGPPCVGSIEKCLCRYGASRHRIPVAHACASWAKDEAVKIHMRWRFVWNCWKRSPTSRNDTLSRLKALFNSEALLSDSEDNDAWPSDDEAILRTPLPAAVPSTCRCLVLSISSDSDLPPANRHVPTVNLCTPARKQASVDELGPPKKLRRRAASPMQASVDKQPAPCRPASTSCQPQQTPRASRAHLISPPAHVELSPCAMPVEQASVEADKTKKKKGPDGKLKAHKKQNKTKKHKKKVADGKLKENQKKAADGTPAKTRKQTAEIFPAKTSKRNIPKKMPLWMH